MSPLYDLPAVVGAVGSNGPYAALQATLRRLNLPRERLHALRAFSVTMGREVKRHAAGGVKIASTYDASIA